MVVSEERHARLVDVEDRQIAALRGDVEPAEPGIDRQDVGPAAGRTEADGVVIQNQPRSPS